MYGPKTLNESIADLLRDYRETRVEIYEGYEYEDKILASIDQVLAYLPAKRPQFDTRSQLDRVIDYLSGKTYCNEYYQDGLKTLKEAVKSHHDKVTS